MLHAKKGERSEPRSRNHFPRSADFQKQPESSHVLVGWPHPLPQAGGGGWHAPGPWHHPSPSYAPLGFVREGGPTALPHQSLVHSFAHFCACACSSKAVSHFFYCGAQCFAAVFLPEFGRRRCQPTAAAAACSKCGLEIKVTATTLGAPITSLNSRS